jgi:O-antigen ligase
MSEIARSAFPARPGIPRTIASWPRSWFWLLCADLYPVLSAAALPWSTTAVVVFMSIWFVVLLPTIDYRSFFRSLQNPASFLPVAFFAVAVVGMLWADSSWTVRLHGLSPVAKLVAIPFLLYHFQRSERGHWAFTAFLASCSVLLGLSWLMYFAPDLQIGATRVVGVPVRNYIDQTQEFALCIFALAVLVLSFVGKQRPAMAVAGTGLLLLFFLNLTFVVLARTAVLYMPVLAILFAVKYLSRNVAISLFIVGILAGALLWSTSPYLRWRVERTVYDYKLNRDTDIATSYGERLAYWRTSIESIGEAPMFGHGTGSTRQIFDEAAEGKSGEWANSIRNPHNQTLYVAIQWGLIGCIFLFAMWYFHLSLFRETTLISWIGLIVVVQNITSSLLNSHLFDFHEGWIYVLGVGIAGGFLARNDPARSHRQDFAASSVMALKKQIERRTGVKPQRPAL